MDKDVRNRVFLDSYIDLAEGGRTVDERRTEFTMFQLANRFTPLRNQFVQFGFADLDATKLSSINPVAWTFRLHAFLKCQQRICASRRRF